MQGIMGLRNIFASVMLDLKPTSLVTQRIIPKNEHAAYQPIDLSLFIHFLIVESKEMYKTELWQPTV